MNNNDNQKQNTNAVEISQLNIGGITHRYFTEDDLDSCWAYYKQYLVDILNGEYKVEDAQLDLAGLIGSQYDSRLTSICNDTVS
jgi:hypothetical protein